MKLFQALNPDAKLLAELYVVQQAPPSQLQTQPKDGTKERQMSVSEDVLAEELEKEVEMVTSMVPTPNVLPFLFCTLHASFYAFSYERNGCSFSKTCAETRKIV